MLVLGNMSFECKSRQDRSQDNGGHFHIIME